MSQSNNPFSETYICTGQTVPAGYGWRWFSGGIKLFMKSPGMWLALNFVYAIFLLIEKLLPLADVLVPFILPFFSVGLLLACQALDRGEPLSISYVFAGFLKHHKKLFMCGLFYTFFFVLLRDIPFMNTKHVSNQFDESWAISFDLGLIMLLFFHELITLQFIPALIAFENEDVFHAIKMGYWVLLRNILPVLVCWVLTFLLCEILFNLLAFIFRQFMDFLQVYYEIFDSMSLYFLADRWLSRLSSSLIVSSFTTCMIYAFIKDVFYVSKATAEEAPINA